jgi:putative Holliday junction resolvase
MRYSIAMRYMGIDYGTKKVGIALSDGVVALPKSVIPNGKDLIAQICEYVSEYGVDTVVVGKSLDLSGGENKLATQVTAFIDNLTTSIPETISIHCVDERYTTKLARAIPTEGHSRGDVANKRGGISSNKQADAQAAALILQTFLDKQANLG